MLKRALIVGTINYYAAPPGWEHVHVDASARPIWDARIPGPVPVDVVADMRHLPFPIRSVQKIQCWHALEHVNEQGGRDAVREFARVLSPGGILNLRVPDMEWCFSQPVVQALHVVYGDQAQMVDAELNLHRWGYTVRSLSALLSQHEFMVVVARGLAGENGDEIYIQAVRPFAYRLTTRSWRAEP